MLDREQKRGRLVPVLCQPVLTDSRSEIGVDERYGDVTPAVSGIPIYVWNTIMEGSRLGPMLFGGD